MLLFIESARRDSNPRPRPWQGRAPPTEPLAHLFAKLFVRYNDVYNTPYLIVCQTLFQNFFFFILNPRFINPGFAKTDKTAANNCTYSQKISNMFTNMLQTTHEMHILMNYTLYCK